MFQHGISERLCTCCDKIFPGIILYRSDNIVGCANEDVYIGMPVEVVFDDMTDEVTLPKFRPVE